MLTALLETSITNGLKSSLTQYLKHVVEDDVLFTNLNPLHLHDLLWTDSRNKSLQKTHQYNTREKNLPKLPKAFNNRYHKGFQFQSIKDYELTPEHIRKAPTLKTFSKRMKDHLLNAE